MPHRSLLLLITAEVLLIAVILVIQADRADYPAGLAPEPPPGLAASPASGPELAAAEADETPPPRVRTRPKPPVKTAEQLAADAAALRARREMSRHMMRIFNGDRRRAAPTRSRADADQASAERPAAGAETEPAVGEAASAPSARVETMGGPVVELPIGTRHGVRVGMTLGVFRRDRRVGRLIVRAVAEESCRGLVVIDRDSGEPAGLLQPGDEVR